MSRKCSESCYSVKYWHKIYYIYQSYFSNLCLYYTLNKNIINYNPLFLPGNHDLHLFCFLLILVVPTWTIQRKPFRWKRADFKSRSFLRVLAFYGHFTRRSVRFSSHVLVVCVQQVGAGCAAIVLGRHASNHGRWFLIAGAARLVSLTATGATLPIQPRNLLHKQTCVGQEKKFKKIERRRPANL